MISQPHIIALVEMKDLAAELRARSYRKYWPWSRSRKQFRQAAKIIYRQAKIIEAQAIINPHDKMPAD
jgi:hypothetical protein